MRDASTVPTVPFVNSTSETVASSHAISTGSLVQEAGRQGADRAELTDEKSGQVDGVTAEDRLRPGRCRGGIKHPAQRPLGIVQALLQVLDPDVIEVAEQSLVDQILRQPDRGNEAVVEAAHMLHAGLTRGVQHAPCIVGGEGHRLLANHMLPIAQRGDRRLGMHVVRGAIVEELDVRIGDQFFPARVVAVIPVALGRLSHARFGPPGDCAKVGPRRTWPEDVGRGYVGIRVRLGHEPVAEQPDVHSALIRIGGGFPKALIAGH
jgi:hypothetical protein